MAKNECVPVVFRVDRSGPFKDQPIALFPTLTERRGGFVTSYVHNGQHGSADYAGVVATTRRARPAEYADLKRELEQIGYCLKVVKRSPSRGSFRGVGDG